jgi:hypothetical protein
VIAVALALLDPPEEGLVGLALLDPPEEGLDADGLLLDVQPVRTTTKAATIAVLLTAQDFIC